MVFGLLAAIWLVEVLTLTREFSFWSDDLFLIDQAGSWGGLIEPYNDHLSPVILTIFRASAELADFSYAPFAVAGAVSLVAVPISFYATARRPMGPPLTAILAMPLLWFDGMNPRPAALNHYLALIGGIACAAALNRGRRADGVLAAGLVVSLASAGGGVVVAAACVVHGVLVRPHARRWLVVLAPTALWACWRLLLADDLGVASSQPLTSGQIAGAVRDLSLSPFYEASLGVRPLAYLLMAGFLGVGVMQLRGGLAAGANFLAW
ncbi:MAG: hypothetical protein ABIP36_06145, partial [Acidimicrobiales bacterium]